LIDIQDSILKKLVEKIGISFKLYRISKFLKKKLTISQDFEGIHQILASGELMNKNTDDFNMVVF
jgi:hypothetical protein